jgi:hypothetical protein
MVGSVCLFKSSFAFYFESFALVVAFESMQMLAHWLRDKLMISNVD